MTKSLETESGDAKSFLIPELSSLYNGSIMDLIFVLAVFYNKGILSLKCRRK